ncbi:MAG TPA: DUF427 domain-containing protein [Caulobacteraceae bacterium]|jgi:uncharacterized protein (DUF427 family)
MDVVKVPGPDHPITISGHSGRMLAVYSGHVIADSGDVLILKEASYKPVAYFPRADVDMAYMARTELDTYCPYKGHAAYYTLAMDGNIAESAVWTYESPHPAMELIRGRLAFYPNVVEVHEARPSGADTSDAVRHTDSGAGASQSGHWTPTAPNPPV